MFPANVYSYILIWRFLNSIVTLELALTEIPREHIINGLNRQIKKYLVSLRLIWRHDLPTCFGEEEALDTKLLRLLLEEFMHFFSRECGESFPLFQDKLLPLNFPLAKVSSSLKELWPTSDPHGVASWSELESYASETSVAPWLSKMARTSAVAFSALSLCRDTILSCSSSSSTF